MKRWHPHIGHFFPGSMVACDLHQLTYIMAYILVSFLAFALTFYLASFVAFYLRSVLAFWFCLAYVRVRAQTELELAIGSGCADWAGVRQSFCTCCEIRVGRCPQWRQAGRRSGGGEGGGRRGNGVATLLKCRDPHLAGGELICFVKIPPNNSLVMK